MLMIYDVTDYNDVMNSNTSFYYPVLPKWGKNAIFLNKFLEKFGKHQPKCQIWCSNDYRFGT